MRRSQGRNEGARKAQFSGRQITMGAPKSSNDVTKPCCAQKSKNCKSLPLATGASRENMLKLKELFEPLKDS